MTVIPVKGHRATLSGCAWGWSSGKGTEAPSTWDWIPASVLSTVIGRALNTGYPPTLPPSAPCTEPVKEPYQWQIEATHQQIDALAYELYGLTAEEIAIVDGRNH
jgi:hypothetical protein